MPCPPHSEAGKYSADGLRLYIVCEKCGIILREADPRPEPHPLRAAVAGMAMAMAAGGTFTGPTQPSYARGSLSPAAKRIKKFKGSKAAKRAARRHK